ncbi:MAG: MmgE/PrpD family protein [Steroidobacteraceae bacterium]
MPRRAGAALLAAARQQARDVFLDCLAVIAAGAAVREHRDWIASAAGEAGDCTAIGRVGGTTLLSAALLNGGATTRLQWQEGHRLARGHPASHLVPALLALAERQGAGAEALMSAFVGGYEAARASAWRSTGCARRCTMRAPGPCREWLRAVPTCSARTRRASLRPSSARRAAACCPGGKPRAAARALITWPSARAQSPRWSRRRRQRAGCGPCPARCRASSVRSTVPSPPLRHSADGIGADGCWSRLELHAAYLKWHPVCAHFSGVADAMQSLLQQASQRTGRPLAREQVRAVEVALCRAALDYDAGIPCTELASRFSVAAIVHASFDPAGLTDSALAATVVAGTPQRDWLQRVRVLHDPLLDAGYPAGRPTRVSLVLDDGSTQCASVFQPYGDAGHPLTAADRRRKLLAALGRYYLPEAAAAVIEAFDAFLDGAPIGALRAALRVPPAQRS